MRKRGWAQDLLIMVVAFVGATALAAALGAGNLGTAMFWGEVAFALAVVWVIVRR